MKMKRREADPSGAQRAREVLAEADTFQLLRLEPETSHFDVETLVVCPWSGCVTYVFGDLADIPAGQIRVSIRAEKRELGTLTMSGSFGCPRVIDPEPLQHTKKSDDKYFSDLGAKTLIGVQLIPDTIRVDVVCDTEADIHRVQSLQVAPLDFFHVRFDSWSLDPKALISHLESEHQSELRNLVNVSTPGLGAVSTFICIDSMNRDALQLVCLNDDGSSTISIPYGAFLSGPQDVVRWVMSYTK